MKIVAIVLPDDNAEVLCITAVGRDGSTINVATFCADLSKGDRIRFDGERWEQWSEPEKNN